MMLMVPYTRGDCVNQFYYGDLVLVRATVKYGHWANEVHVPATFCGYSDPTSAEVCMMLGSSVITRVDLDQIYAPNIPKKEKPRAKPQANNPDVRRVRSLRRPLRSVVRVRKGRKSSKRPRATKQRGTPKRGAVRA